MSSRTNRIVVACALVQLIVAASLLTYRSIGLVPASLEQAVVGYRDTGGAMGPPSSALREPAAGGILPDGTAAAPDRRRGPAEGLTERPEEGVYLWETKGSERIGSLPARSLPERSLRTIVHEGAGRWRIAHREGRRHHTERVHELGETGLWVDHLEVRLPVGPLSAARGLAFDPPLRLAVFPFEAGQRWYGSFDGGRTAGTYRGRTARQAVLRIEGDRVDAWAVELRLDLEGAVRGRVKLDLWISPRYGGVVREAYDVDVRSGRFSYRARWTSTLLDPVPRR